MTGIVVAIVTVYLAGIRFQNEEQARLVRESREAIRRMTTTWAVDVGLFIEGQRDLPIVTNDDAERYRMCSAVIEASRSLRALDRMAVRQACRSLFGREILDLAERYPYDVLKEQSGFMLAAAIFTRGQPGEGGSRSIEMGHFGQLFVLRRMAERNGSIALGSEVPKIEGGYRARNILYVLGVIKEVRWYHAVVLSRPWQRLVQYSRRNVSEGKAIDKL